MQGLCTARRTASSAQRMPGLALIGKPTAKSMHSGNDGGVSEWTVSTSPIQSAGHRTTSAAHTTVGPVFSNLLYMVKDSQVRGIMVCAASGSSKAWRAAPHVLEQKHRHMQYTMH